jgi:hypothetical protein
MASGENLKLALVTSKVRLDCSGHEIVRAME